MPSVLDWMKLMYGGQTPQANDTVGYHTNPDLGDAVYDQYGMTVTDPDKLAAYKASVKGGWAGEPYKPITGMSSTFNPEASNYVAEQNAQYKLRGTMAANEASPYFNNNPNRKLLESKLGVYNPANYYAMFGARPVSPTQLTPEMAATSYNYSGGSDLDAANRLATQNLNLYGTQREIQQAPMAYNLRGQTLANQYQQASQIDPITLRTAQAQALAQGGFENTREQAQKAALQQELATNLFGQGMAENQLRQLPENQSIYNNQTTAALARSQFVDLPAIASRINPDNTISKPDWTGYGTTPMTQAMIAYQHMPSVNGGTAGLPGRLGTGTLIGADGKVIRLGPPLAEDTYNPRANMPTTGTGAPATPPNPLPARALVNPSINMDQNIGNWGEAPNIGNGGDTQFNRSLLNIPISGTTQRAVSQEVRDDFKSNAIDNSIRALEKKINDPALTFDAQRSPASKILRDHLISQRESLMEQRSKLLQSNK